MKRRIGFQKLIDGGYNTSTELQVFDWMLSTGMRHKTYRQGLDQLLFGYSAYNHESYSNMLLDTHQVLFVGFCNALVKTPNTVTAKWKEAERVSLDTYRVLDIKEEYPDPYVLYKNHYWGIERALMYLGDYVGRGLKKKYFHPDFPRRTHPRIINLDFSTAGDGYQILFNFTFKQTEGSSWRFEIHQKRNESIDMFVARAHRKIKRMLL